MAERVSTMPSDCGSSWEVILEREERIPTYAPAFVRWVEKARVKVADKATAEALAESWRAK
jgi:hypothetical protein